MLWLINRGQVHTPIIKLIRLKGVLFLFFPPRSGFVQQLNGAEIAPFGRDSASLRLRHEKCKKTAFFDAKVQLISPIMLRQDRNRSEVFRLPETVMEEICEFLGH